VPSLDIIPNTLPNTQPVMYWCHQFNISTTSGAVG